MNSQEPRTASVTTNSLHVVITGLCAALLLLSSSCAKTSEPALVETKPRTTVSPRVTQVDDAGIKDLLKPRGKPLLANFWATWCGPCREEFPDLVKIDNEYRGRIDFITVSLDFVEELETGVPKFLSEMNAEMPTYLLVSADENVIVTSISKDWSGALPFTILYDANGGITYSRQGKVSHEVLKGEIEKTLGSSGVD